MTTGAAQRLFVAWRPPLRIVEALARSAGSLTLPAHRPTPTDQVHLTVLFLGPVETRERDHVEESIERATSGIGAFRIEPKRLVTLPRRGPARVVACETNSPPELLELHRRLVVRLARPGQRREEFLPHLTLARFTSPCRAEVEQAIEMPSIDVTQVSLVRSILRHTGVEHAIIRHFTLG